MSVRADLHRAPAARRPSRTRATAAARGRGAGTLTLRALDPFTDTELVHSWVTHPKAPHWQRRDAKLHHVEREYMGIAASEHHHAYLGLLDGEPAFLMERYDPLRAAPVDLYEPEPGDVGLHVLLAPDHETVPDFAETVLATALEYVFADPAAQRVVVESDAADTQARRRYEAVGFVPECETGTPDGLALLSFCARERFEAAVVRRAVAGRPPHAAA
ncbi:acetyltransferase [Streptomyces longispororuber]|uniref:Lysine N-acyltransferase MbtK n=1 Tax=Streptomyces longispororuber TaxID=68230 RepID=A0A919DM44_9ACTN|nr:acetyltransferase [Streptomyces longispororuber]